MLLVLRRNPAPLPRRRGAVQRGSAPITRASMLRELRPERGNVDGLIGLSEGCADKADLIADLDQAPRQRAPRRRLVCQNELKHCGRPVTSTGNNSGVPHCPANALPQTGFPSRKSKAPSEFPTRKVSSDVCWLYRARPFWSVWDTWIRGTGRRTSPQDQASTTP